MVRFTQFLRPNGKKREVEVHLDHVSEEKAHAIIESGHHFEIEELSNGLVSATIVHDEMDEDVAHARIVPNGPQVILAITKMICDFKVL